MELEIVGRHVLLFDDDASAAFVNSREALVDWNSLLIDRYDVRHLLQNPPSPLKRRSLYPPSLEESQLDQQRYLDLPQSQSPSDDDPHSSLLDNNGAQPTHKGGYHTVVFSYGNADVSTGAGNLDVSGYLPPFPVPETLLQNLLSEYLQGFLIYEPFKPPTEKLHQIMSRTAMFVSKHGGQSEIVLRVKQGDNPTFGFLMPDHHLHPYFRFLVDHPEVWNSDNGDTPKNKDNKDDFGQNKTGDTASGALSLLGSVYGSGDDDDDDGATQVASESKKNESGNSSITAKGEEKVSLRVLSKDDKGKVYPRVSSEKNEMAMKKPIIAAKEKDILSERNHSVARVNLDKPRASSLPLLPNAEPLVVEPPSHLKAAMDKIVEFVLRNGKEFEAVLIQQDSTSGKFSFLVPSNLYHAYYLKLLQKAQESKQAGKISVLSKDMDSVSNRSTSLDLPDDLERKEKFKMVISGSKKDSQDPPPKPTQQREMSMDAMAAILQAATGGARNAKLNIFPKTSSGNECVPEKGSEADSSEAHLTKEQKLKAERLKRAKVFAAMVKSGGKPNVKDLLPRLSVDPPDCTRVPDDEVVNPVLREAEGSPAPVDIDISQKIQKFRKRDSDDDCKERKSRKYRVKSRRVEKDDDVEEEEEEEESDHKHSRKKHRSSRHSSHHSRDERKHRKPESERRHKQHDSSEDEHRHRSRSYKHRETSNSERDVDGEDVIDLKPMSKNSSRQASLDQLNDRWEGSTPLSPEAQPSNTTEVPDDLRAKVRAMLLSTM
ncbi:hypothetical protein GIB67_026961 [Kingdonia uniflora]|uniref:SURP motif domain-containing protein n=1 Tax=Kingdonia uniflora TaxID=39325 RepID=A0A7J7P1E4_9MAGN|nr:hypothetical protein GIB67_026961 [Kingdonia uniflora]